MQAKLLKLGFQASMLGIRPTTRLGTETINGFIYVGLWLIVKVLCMKDLLDLQSPSSICSLFIVWLTSQYLYTLLFGQLRLPPSLAAVDWVNY
jgi:hypothetical protein